MASIQLAFTVQTKYSTLKHSIWRLPMCAGVTSLFAAMTQAAEIAVRLDNPPAQGTIIVMLFDSANTFGDIRDAVKTARFPVGDAAEYSIAEVAAGDYALLVYHDENGNGRLDENFVGIPREPIGFSNRYRPKGPPGYSRARFQIQANERREFAVELYRPLGRRGRFGVGPGIIARSSPYRGSSDALLQAIPAVTYIGERLQVLGPQLRIGLLDSGRLRLAATASYRIGAYEEDDSSLLAGLGDRNDTLMAGFGFQYELPAGVELSARYEHDVLDRIGGGAAQLAIKRSFQSGVLRLAPSVALNWQSARLSNHDFGVPDNRGTSARPVYTLADTVSVEAGIGGFIELSRNWRIILNGAVEFLEDDVTDSPIVDEDRVYKGFAAIIYLL